MKGILVGSGSILKEEFFYNEYKNADIVLAVDGGMNFFEKIKTIPDVLIGDLDSIDERIDLNRHNLKIVTYPKEKNYTDMELGLDYLIDKNCNEIVILSGTGSRLDHTIINLFLLKKVSLKGIDVKIIDNNNEVTYINSCKTIYKGRFTYISIIPINDFGITVTLKGFKYPLKNYRLKFGETLGISNEIIDEKAEIEVIEGEALVIKSKD